MVFLFQELDLEEEWLPEWFHWIVIALFILVVGRILVSLFMMIENWYASVKDKPLYRHILVYRKLEPEQLTILENEFPFYSELSPKYQKEFEHRLAKFIESKEFIGQEGLLITEQMRVLIGAKGCQLSFGRKHYLYPLIKYILIFPEPFYSIVSKNYHKGEFNPSTRILAISWRDFSDGYHLVNDNRDLAIHEFMHAMQLESIKFNDLDSLRFERQFKNIMQLLIDPEVRTKLDMGYFRDYAFTNQYEFMAVLAEYFFETPEQFKDQFPKLYDYVKRLLGFHFNGY